jgi:N6-adenosine-specific RNA methylase IME4
VTTSLLQTPRPVGGYRAILADPPWAFEAYSGPQIPGQVQHYATMHLDRLRLLPVRQMAARECALFMWIIDSHLPQALTLGAAWGFQFKTVAFIWDKGDFPGMGHWTRKQAELCLLFTRGRPPRMDAGVRQIIRAPRREHSRKPDEIYDRVGRLVRGPYLELFARQAWPGWTAWGNETDLFPVSAP